MYIYLFIYSVQLSSTPVLFAAAAQSRYLRRYMFRPPVVAIAAIMIQTQAAIGVSVKGAAQFSTVLLN